MRGEVVQAPGLDTRPDFGGVPLNQRRCPTHGNAARLWGEVRNAALTGSDRGDGIGKAAIRFTNSETKAWLL